MSLLVVMNIQEETKGSYTKSDITRLQGLCSAFKNVLWSTKVVPPTLPVADRFVPRHATCELRRTVIAATKQLLDMANSYKDGEDDSIYLCGSEFAHSIYPTAVRLVDLGYRVYLVTDFCFDAYKGKANSIMFREVGSGWKVSTKMVFERECRNVDLGQLTAQLFQKANANLINKISSTHTEELQYLSMSLAKYLSGALAYKGGAFYYFDCMGVWRRQKLSEYAGAVVPYSEQHITDKMAKNFCKGLRERDVIGMPITNNKPLLEGALAREIQILNSLRVDGSTLSNFVEMLAADFGADAPNDMAVGDGPTAIPFKAKDLVSFTSIRLPKLVMKITDTSVYYFDAFGVYRVADIDGLDISMFKWYVPYYNEDTLNKLKEHLRLRGKKGHWLEVRSDVVLADVELEKEVINSLVVGRSSAENFVADVTQRRRVHIIDLIPSAAVRAEVVLFNLFSKDPTVRMRRDPGNDNKDTFDYIDVELFFTSVWGQYSRKLIKEYKPAILKHIWDHVEESANFKRFGVPVSMLKVTHIAHNTTVMNVTIDFKEEKDKREWQASVSPLSLI